MPYRALTRRSKQVVDFGPALAGLSNTVSFTLRNAGPSNAAFAIDLALGSPKELPPGLSIKVGCTHVVLRHVFCMPHQVCPLCVARARFSTRVLLLQSTAHAA
jgi:hypothetical protein